MQGEFDDFRNGLVLKWRSHLDGSGSWGTFIFENPWSEIADNFSSNEFEKAAGRNYY